MIFEMDTSSFESLKSSIKEDGLEVPIAINDVGVLLDGHHRLKALKEIGKSKVWVIKYQFNSDLDEELFVVDVNLKRRHLTMAQQGTLRARRVQLIKKYRKNKSDTEMANMATKGNITDEIVAKETGVGKRTVTRDVAREKIIQKHKKEPEIKQVKNDIQMGKIKTSNDALKKAKEAEQKIKERKDQEAEERAKKEKKLSVQDVINKIDEHGLTSVQFTEIKPLIDQLNDRLKRQLVRELTRKCLANSIVTPLDDIRNKLNKAQNGAKEIERSKKLWNQLLLDHPEFVEQAEEIRIEYLGRITTLEDELEKLSTDPENELDKIFTYLGGR
jgi:ParB-like chromosome segregation protein Spo0J